MQAPMISIRRELLELIEQTWQVPGTPEDQSHPEPLKGSISAGLQEVRQALARKREQDDAPQSLLPLPDSCNDLEVPASEMYTGDQMRDYALANIQDGVVAWRFQRPPAPNGMFGLDWPEVNRVILDEQHALAAAASIDDESPGSLIPLRTRDLASELRKALIKASSLEVHFCVVGAKDEQAKLKAALAELWQDLESMRALNQDAVNALFEISVIEDELYGHDWDKIERAREIAKAALGICRAPLESFTPSAAYKTYIPPLQH